MGMMSHISDAYDAFYFYRFSFSSMTSLTMMVLGPDHLVRVLFHFPLKVHLVMGVAQNVLIVLVEY